MLQLSFCWEKKKYRSYDIIHLALHMEHYQQVSWQHLALADRPDNIPPIPDTGQTNTWSSSTDPCQGSFCGTFLWKRAVHGFCG